MENQQTFESMKPQNTLTGELEWSHLFRPDFEYNKRDGVFSAGLKLRGADAGGIIDIVREAAGLESKASNRTDFAKPPFYEDEEDGENIFKFKQNAVIYPKGEEPITMKVDVYDAKRNPWPPGLEIGKGSKIKIRYKANSWVSDEQGGVGVTLRLIAVQVIHHVPYVPSHGFEEEEGVDMSGGGQHTQGAADDIPMGTAPAPASTGAHPAAQNAEKPYENHTGGPVVGDVPF